jgi:hypothetical protein
MPSNAHSPWASGPGEILRHGLDLLKRDTDTNRRLAMISIDNSVELMIKTFLGLPKRLNGLSISRKEFQEISESFPKLLDALEQHCQQKLDGIDLGTIEWYHRLRNELYHQGNGLTVERDKVVIYAELANLLFKNLFGSEIVHTIQGDTELLGEFMASWVAFEAALRRLVTRHKTSVDRDIYMTSTMKLLQSNIFSGVERREMDELRQIRNQVIHGQADFKTVITPDIVKRLQTLTQRLIDKE